jgi:hypothetical protein
LGTGIGAGIAIEIGNCILLPPIGIAAHLSINGCDCDADPDMEPRRFSGGMAANAVVDPGGPASFDSVRRFGSAP